MGLAAYTIVGNGGEWRIRHDGKDDNVYQTKEIGIRGSSSVLGPQTRSRGSDQRTRQRNSNRGR